MPYCKSADVSPVCCCIRRTLSVLDGEVLLIQRRRAKVAPNMRVLLWVLLLPPAALCSAGTSNDSSHEAPNVVFIVLDDLGYADVGFTQETPLPEVKTPNIDALAKRGVIFTNGYSSGEVCAPTRAGFMMGRYQEGVGIYSARSGGGDGMEILRHNPESGAYDNVNPWIPQFLKQDGVGEGVVAGAFGKWHLGLDVVFKVDEEDSIYRYKNRVDTQYGEEVEMGDDGTARVYPTKGPMVTEAFDYTPVLWPEQDLTEVSREHSDFDDRNGTFVPCEFANTIRPCFEVKNNTLVACEWVLKRDTDKRCARSAANGELISDICSLECSLEKVIVPAGNARTLPNVYSSIAQLGEAGSPYHPLYRGFDAASIFMGRGAKDYWDPNDFYITMDKNQPNLGRTASMDDRKNPGNANHPNKDQEPLESWDANATEYIIHRERTPSTYVTNNITDAAVDFIRANARGSKPFFAYVPYNAPHYPAQSPYHFDPFSGKLDRIGEDARRYAGMPRNAFKASGLEDRWFAPGFSDDDWFPDPIFIYETYKESGFTDIGVESYAECCSDDDVRRRAITTAMNRFVDKGVGKIVAALKDPNGDGDISDSILEDTIIIFISDNGGAAKMRASNKPLTGMKGELYEGGHRVPFFVAWDSFLSNVDGKGKDVRGTTNDTPITSLDILPTILDAFGINDSASNPLLRSSPSDGKSLLPVLQGTTDSLHEYLFWAYESSGSFFEGAVRKGIWKLLINRRESSGLELFNLVDDPVESNNLVEEYPDIVQDLQEAFITWMNEMSMRNGEEGPNWRMGEMFDKAEQNYNITAMSDEGLTSPNRSGANERDETPVGATVDDATDRDMIDEFQSSTTSDTTFSRHVPGISGIQMCVLFVCFCLIL